MLIQLIWFGRFKAGTGLTGVEMFFLSSLFFLPQFDSSCCWWADFNFKTQNTLWSVETHLQLLRAGVEWQRPKGGRAVNMFSQK